MNLKRASKNIDDLWNEAKRRCRIGEEEVRIAKELGISPRSLIKNIPSKSESWKAPIKDWLHSLYEKRQKKVEQKAKRKAKNAEKTQNTVNASENKTAS